MSKLDELIKKYCPNGVEHKKIKEEFQRIKGTPITAAKMKEIASENGEIRIFAGGKTVINAHEKDIPKANITRVPAVLVQSRGVIDAVYYDKPFTFKNEMWAYTHQKQASVRYLYYVLKNNIIYFRDAASGMGSLPQISLSVTEEFVIPIPPLPVQEEIVRILDSFTQLTAELQAELQARQRQYEYYRDYLLNFNDVHWGGILEVQWRTLGEICIIKTGKKPERIESRETCFEYINAGTSNSGFVNNFNCSGDTITTPSRGQGGIGFVGYQANNFWLGPLCYQIRSRDDNGIINKYIYYYLKNKPELILQYKNEGGTPSVNASDLKNIEILIPNIKIQQRIVSILDRFDALCNDFSSGLPAEITARQKQYEYYRDKILNFKKETEQ